MDAKRISATAHHLIDSMDDALHHAIEVFRDSGAHLGQAARERWDTALAQSSPQLSTETLRNAQRTQAWVAGCYTHGIERSAASAEATVDAVLKVARTAMQRVQDRPRA